MFPPLEQFCIYSSNFYSFHPLMQLNPLCLSSTQPNLVV